MSRRGIDFLNDWIAEHLPKTFIEDPAAIMDLGDQLLLAAEKQGLISTGYSRGGWQPLPGHSSYWSNIEAMAAFTKGKPDIVHHLDRDPELLIELPERIEIHHILIDDQNLR